MEADLDGDGKLSFEEFTNVVAKTVRLKPLLLGYVDLCSLFVLGYCKTNDPRAPVLAFLYPSPSSASGIPPAF